MSTDASINEETEAKQADVDVVALDAETTDAQGTEGTEVEASPDATENTEPEAQRATDEDKQRAAPRDPNVIERLEEVMGEQPVGSDDVALESLKKTDWEKLPSDVKGPVRELVRHVKGLEAKLAEANKNARGELSDERAELDEMRKGLLRDQQAFYQLFDSPEFKDLLAKSKIKDADLPDGGDPLSKRGLIARLERDIAKKFGAFTEPFQVANAGIQRRAAYEAIVARNPEMKDETFVKAVNARIVKAKESGESVQGKLERFIKDERASRIIASENSRRARERTLRNKSASRIAARTSTVGQKPGDPPPHIQKAFKDRDWVAIDRWRQSDPKGWDAYRRAQGLT
ncbi:MAG: hypothetical protein GY913_21475 [Proteobacteria bacterium]|nr:hypothetical protein [Actinomycetes bacterium]MCP4919480.1 hypothetical protein [Pseudomonadota bacterium]